MADTPTPNPIDVQVGARVRVRRLQMGVSQTDLADAIGVSFQQVQKYEKGSNRVSASRLVEIAQVLKVSPCVFFDELACAPSTAAETLPNALVASREGMALAAAFLKVQSPEVRRSIVHFVQTVAEKEGAKGV